MNIGKVGTDLKQLLFMRLVKFYNRYIYRPTCIMWRRSSRIHRWKRNIFLGFRLQCLVVHIWIFFSEFLLIEIMKRFLHLIRPVSIEYEQMMTCWQELLRDY